MKKKLFAIGCLVGLLLMGGCGSSNKDLWDTVYHYDYAIIELPNGSVVEGAVDKWTDYTDGDQLQITINGNVYLVHSSKCVLIKNK